MQGYSIIAQLKKKSKTDITATIYIRGYFNRKAVAAITTGKVIQIQHWDPVKRELHPSAPNASLINMVIKSKVQAMEKEIMRKEIMGTSINSIHIKKIIQGIDEKKDFFSFCRQQITFYSNKETARQYTGEVTKIEQFQSAVSFSDIDYNFLTRYRKYMKTELSNENNTIWKSFKFINTMVNKAIKAGGIIDKNPFDQFDRGKYIQGHRKWLEISDCNKIEELVTNENETIRKGAIYFLLMAYTGMRFSDAMRFDPAVHVVNNERIMMKYQKAGTDVNIKFYDRLERIVELVRYNRVNTTNKTFNQWLKIVGGMCGIPFNLSAHIGRHTMGGLLAEMEIKEEQARQIMGHKNIQSTRIYYHIKNKTIDAAMDKMNSF